ncbi:ATP-dependent DNA helicase [Carnobacterium gallinarum]|uniref:ATP-dependent DNA helicase n=1 Tax=Carnobacterium gallinarum TaxID=2749 RepID=UPI000556A0BE|nr:ATP-dependent DNA helicase [Carnobacterium gallinarum]
MVRKRIAVRQLVSFILRKGSIDQRFASSAHTALEGTRLHKKIQKAAGESYQAEVFLKKTLLMNGLDYTIEGRADGVIREEETMVMIDEIKTSETPFDLLDDAEKELHWGQLKCYGYLLCQAENLSEVRLQLSYFQTTTEELTKVQEVWSQEELTQFFYDLIQKYEKWLIFSSNWTKLRNQSIQELEFPYGSYRNGQRELAVAVYKTILTEQELFCEAPTGIGKTMSTLFPAVKAIGEEKAEKLFYLTAKTITRQVAEDAVAEMERKGLRLKSVTITAKDKICFLDERICNPDHCIYARGYYDRLNEAMFDLLTAEDQITRSVVEKYAVKYTICPFELSLDVSLWCDTIICDYNYLFDPNVYLRRFFTEEKNEYVFLIDEVHNLVERSKSMFSASLSRSQISRLKKTVHGEDPKLVRAVNRLDKDFVAFKKNCEGRDFLVQTEPADTFVKHIAKFTEAAKAWLPLNLQSEHQAELLAVYFDALMYLKIAELYDERYVTYIQVKGHEVTIKQLCLNPSYLLNQALKLGKAAILFSATLSPISYFSQVLGGTENPLCYQLPSPFSMENQLLLVSNYIDTRYQNREDSLEPIADSLSALISGKKGNYLFFFPSYHYLDAVYAVFSSKYPHYQTIIQASDMDEAEREAFLAEFVANPQEGLAGFCVLGGIFSEGIDLKGDRLIGVAVISVGLGQLNLEQDLVKKYYDHENGQGYQYAYQIPGMNKVLQAAGRVIRGSQDLGVVLLLDQRFDSGRYRMLFPEHWSNARLVTSKEHVVNEIQQFWNKKNLI